MVIRRVTSARPLTPNFYTVPAEVAQPMVPHLAQVVALRMSSCPKPEQLQDFQSTCFGQRPTRTNALVGYLLRIASSFSCTDAGKLDASPR